MTASAAKNPALATSGLQDACQVSTADASEDISRSIEVQPPRLRRVAETIINILHILPVAGDPGYPAPSNLAADLATVFKARLGPGERLLLATSTMRSLNTADAEKLAEEALAALQNGGPIVPFTSLRDEARNWASFASPGELRTYFAACWNCLTDVEQDEFLRTVRSERRPAA